MIEVCVDSLDAALMAVDSGADRIELSERLIVGGVSPNAKLIQSVRDAISVPLVILIRCREGGFYYDSDEKEEMIAQACRSVELGADAIAIGGLMPNNSLDLDFLRKLISLQLSCEWVMHRAFDEVSQPKQELEKLIQVGFNRVLTSGGPPTAIDGVKALKNLVQWADGRIQILPAGGIGRANARDILTLTGCDQLHGSFRSDPFSTTVSDLPNPTIIRTLREILDSTL